MIASSTGVSGASQFVRRPVVMWFRRDLRLTDHAALIQASEAGPVIPLFVVDPAFATAGPVRTTVVAAAVDALSRSITERGGQLVVRHGDPRRLVADLVAEVGARRVFVTGDFTPCGTRRDTEVGAALASIGAELVSVGSPYMVSPGTITKADHTPYSVFTPFFRRWSEQNRAESVARVAADAGDVEWVSASGDRWDGASPEVLERVDCDISEVGAWKRWDAFAVGGSGYGLDAYATDRDVPGVDGTSRMSMYLKCGIVHPAQLLAQLDWSAPGPAAFARELAFRDFYADVTYHHPGSVWRNLNPRYDQIRVDDGPAATARFGAWCTGTTGFPIVDAGMRQLTSIGWMHNRVRMIVASFLVKDLHLPWQWGARFFLQHLVDGDIASNAQGWQWAAGSGTDAAPYFRVFNPTKQFERWDRSGDYVARWVPEWGTPLYPQPIVDHAVERAEALARYAEISHNRSAQ